MISDSTLREYNDIFVQRLPIFGEKKDAWFTVHGALSDHSIRQHLSQERIIGTLATYYPNYMVIDCDDVNFEELAMIRETLRLDDSNSIICSSFSKNSYHIYARPIYKGKPATINLLQKIMEPISKLLSVEIFPCKNKVFRLPFGINQRPIHEHIGIQNVEEFLYWFNKLDEYELSEVSKIPLQESQIFSDENKTLLGNNDQWFKDAIVLLESGLTSSGTRHESQAKILYYYWRHNVCEEHAVALVLDWILKKHNNLSTDIWNSNRVEKEIRRQAYSMYAHFERKEIYPDSTNNSHNGWTALEDIRNAAALSNASFRQLEFNLELFAYLAPRQHRDRISLHSYRVLRNFGRGYKDLLLNLEEKKMIVRSSSYLPGARSKSLKLSGLKLSDPSSAIVSDSRNLTPLDAIRKSLSPEDLRSILLSVNFDYQKIRRIITKVY